MPAGKPDRSWIHGRRTHRVNLVSVSGLLQGIEPQPNIYIDSLLPPVYGHCKQGASYEHAKIAGTLILRRACRR